MNRLDDHEDQAGAWDVLRNQKGSLAFDIGANIGQAAKVLAQTFDKVISFEPCWESYEILRDESPQNVVAISMAVSDTNGEVELFETSRHIQSGQLTSFDNNLDWGHCVGSRTVPCVTLVRAINLFGIPDFIKIDTEGHEVRVIRGGVAFYEAFAPPLLIECHHENSYQEIVDLLPEYEWEVLRHGDYVDHAYKMRHYWMVGEMSELSDKVKSLAIKKYSRAMDAKDKVLSADLDAYKRLRHSGLQPPSVDGAAELEKRAVTKEEITWGRLLDAEQRTEAKVRMDAARQFTEDQ